MANARSDVLLGVSTFNEGEHIEEWLAFWHDLVDDIVVVDQSSTDDTVAKVEAFIREHEGDGGTVELYHAPTFGKCEPVYQAIQLMATQSDKWMLKLDVDEWMTRGQLNRLMTLATKMFKTDRISAFILPRKNLVDGIDISRVFAGPSDPKGRDWQIRLSRGMTLSFSFDSHTHPGINGRWMLVDPEVASIEHRRTFEGIVRANITRENYMHPQARQHQRMFISRVGEILGKTQEEVMAEVQKYV